MDNTIKMQNTPVMMKTEAKTAKKKAEQADVKTEDNFTKGKEDYDEEITIGQALKGFAGAAINGVTEAVGGLGVTVVNMPGLLIRSYKALAKTEAVGRNLKIAIGGVGLPLAASLATVLSPLAGGIWGACAGFKRAAEDGIGDSVKKGFKDIKDAHKELKDGKLSEVFEDIENAKPEEGEEPFDISIKGTGKAVVGGVAGMAVEGVGAAGVGAWHEPGLYVKGMKALWKSDEIGPVLKTSITGMSVPVAVLAVPLVTVAGALWGLGEGMGKGYQEGVGAAVKQAGKRVKWFHDICKETKEHLDEDINRAK